jgi:hypothetical protein
MADAAADAENAKSSTDDGALLAVEATDPAVTDPVILQEPDRSAAPIEESVQSDAPKAISKPAKRQSALWPFLIGGVLIGAATLGVQKYVFPETGTASAIAALQTELAAKQAGDAKLQSDLALMAARPLPDATLGTRIADVEAKLAALPDSAAFETRLLALEDRLTAIEAASRGGEGAPAAALAAMDGQIKDLKAAFEAQKGTVPALTADIEAASAAAQARLDAAELAAETAAKQAASSHIRAAFESGAPIGPALESLKAMGVEIPAALANTTGPVPTLLALQDGFPGPARAALDAAIRADMGDGWAGRLTSFLRTQSGARSLTPREGADPDAVLSRAEAALQSGQIKAVLTELADLPPAGAEAMAPWIADATRRLDTEQAISDLSATLNGQ